MRTALLCLLTLLGGYLPQAHAVPLDQQVYIWQRQWLPAHAEALAQSRDDFTTLRVLALQAHPQAGWARAYPDLQQLKRDGRPLVAVVRLDGQLQQLDTPTIERQITDLLHDWQTAGVVLRGVEIDHDCATARLPAYTKLLSDLRKQLPPALALSITALPAWMDSPALDDLLHQVDSSVLQVHAVNDPKTGLFDPDQAHRWAERYAQRASKPFLLALPAYSVAIVDTNQGAPLIESETPLQITGTRHELAADPEQVAGLLARLRRDPPDHLAGTIWFRLPLPGDRRAWSLATLRAVVRGEPLAASIRIDTSMPGPLHELSLINDGNRDGAAPHRITLLGSDCEAADALAGYRLQRQPHGLSFIREADLRLAAGQRRALGWARCQTFVPGDIHVQP